jgi:hypothetical protein
LTTSIITPPFSISASPFFSKNVPFSNFLSILNPHTQNFPALYKSY